MENEKILTLKERKALLENSKAEQAAKASATKTAQPPSTDNSAEFQKRKKSIAASLSGNSPSGSTKPTPKANSGAEPPPAAFAASKKEAAETLSALFGTPRKPPAHLLQNVEDGNTGASAKPVAAEETASAPAARPRPAFLGAINKRRSSSPEAVAVSTMADSATLGNVDTSKLSALFANRKPPVLASQSVEPVNTNSSPQPAVEKAAIPVTAAPATSSMEQPSTVSVGGLFGAITNSVPAPLDQATKAQYIAELKKVKDHYGSSLNQGHEKFMNLLGSNKKTSTNSKSRAQAKETVARELRGLIKAEMPNIATAFLKLLTENDLNAADFFEGKTSAILSQELIQLLKGDANTLGVSPSPVDNLK